MAQWIGAALKLVIAITTLTLATASQRSSGILNRNQEPFTAIDQGFKSLTEAASTGQKHRRLASDDTANCASAKGTSCFTYTASDKPQLSDMMTLVAADLATKAYNTSAVGIDYVKSVLGAADARFIQDSATGTQVLVAIDDAAVIISFRGTEPTKSADKKTNTLVELVPTSFGSAGTGSVHKGFLQALESVYSDLSSLLREENSERNKKIYFTGHSLGSALATLAAAKVQADTSLGQSVSGVYSLAGPRVGDASWAEAYSELGLDAKTLRIVYYKDGVPLIPPESMDYTHVGRTTILPLDDSTCFETAEQEYDVCETDENIFDFVATLTAKFACAAFENIVIGGYCAISNNAYAATMCPFLDLDSLKGNLCCAAIEAGIQYLDGSQTFLVSTCSQMRLVHAKRLTFSRRSGLFFFLFILSYAGISQCRQILCIHCKGMYTRLCLSTIPRVRRRLDS